MNDPIWFLEFVWDWLVSETRIHFQNHYPKPWARKKNHQISFASVSAQQQNLFLACPNEVWNQYPGRIQNVNWNTLEKLACNRLKFRQGKTTELRVWLGLYDHWCRRLPQLSPGASPWHYVQAPLIQSHSFPFLSFCGHPLYTASILGGKLLNPNLSPHLQNEVNTFLTRLFYIKHLVRYLTHSRYSINWCYYTLNGHSTHP